MRKPAVFISSSSEALPIAQEFALQLAHSTTPTLWTKGAFNLGQTPVESLTELADRTDFAIFILTADDTGFGTPRPNLMFEMGFMAGRIGLPRLFVVFTDADRILKPSDLTGIMVMHARLQAHTAGPDLSAGVAPLAGLIAQTITELGERSERRREFSSCFISYSWRDKDFSVRLHADLQEAGVRCWLDAKELKPGDSIQLEIDRAMQAHDKVLLVLSRASVKSSWVHAEIRKAFELERARKATVLFPVRLDDAILEADATPEFQLLRDRLIRDFSGWQSRHQYQKAFSRLVRDLAITASVESGRGD